LGDGFAHRDFLELAARLPSDLDDYTFVDVGCGGGRALLLAWRLGFHKLIGIELLPSFVWLARRNSERYRDPEGSVDIEVVFPFDPLDCVAISDFARRLGEGLLRRCDRSLCSTLRHGARAVGASDRGVVYCSSGSES
jgi:SAM-dependent methyltransferase